MSPTTSIVLGACAACAASSMYNVGVALQAVEARAVPVVLGRRLTLLSALVRRPRWVLGTALGLVGWPLQALALVLAPLTVVQPALAFGLALLLVIGARTLNESVGRGDVLAVAAIIAGVAVLAAISPAHVAGNAAGAGVLAVGLTALGLLALAPWLRRRGSRVGGFTAALSAGTAFAWSGVSTALVADALRGGTWLPVIAWTLATGAASGFALFAEMSALQRRPATRVAPLVFSAQVILPVALAPALTGDAWAHGAAGSFGTACSLALVIAGAAALCASPTVRSFVDAAPSS